MKLSSCATATSTTATIPNTSPASLSRMTTDHHNYQPGPTLPPLRPFSFPSNHHQSAAQLSHHSLSHPSNSSAQSASPNSQSNHQSAQSPATPSANRSNHHSSSYHHSYQHSKLSPRRDRDSDRQLSSSVCQDQDKYIQSKRASHAHLVPPPSHSNAHYQPLKRTASRAELDQQASRGREEIVHAERKSKHDQPESNLQV
jgi:hypothetical protein